MRCWRAMISPAGLGSESGCPRPPFTEVRPCLIFEGMGPPIRLGHQAVGGAGDGHLGSCHAGLETGVQGAGAPPTRNGAHAQSVANGVIQTNSCRSAHLHRDHDGAVDQHPKCPLRSTGPGTMKNQIRVAYFLPVKGQVSSPVWMGPPGGKRRSALPTTGWDAVPQESHVVHDKAAQHEQHGQPCRLDIFSSMVPALSPECRSVFRIQDTSPASKSLQKLSREKNLSPYGTKIFPVTPVLFCTCIIDANGSILSHMSFLAMRSPAPGPCGHGPLFFFAFWLQTDVLSDCARRCSGGAVLRLLPLSV